MKGRKEYQPPIDSEILYPNTVLLFPQEFNILTFQVSISWIFLIVFIIYLKIKIYIYIALSLQGFNHLKIELKGMCSCWSYFFMQQNAHKLKKI